MKHVRSIDFFKINEDVLTDENSQKMVEDFLIGLNKGTYQAEVAPEFKEPDDMEPEGSFKEEIDVKIKDADFSFMFQVDWSYRTRKGMRSPKPREIPDDPNEVILTSLIVSNIFMYDGKGTQFDIRMTKNIQTLAETYLEDFVEVDEIDC